MWTGIFQKYFGLALEEDQANLDFTTLAVTSETDECRAFVLAKSAGIWTGEQALKALPFSTFSTLQNGDRFSQGMKVCEWSGKSREVLAYERPFLNLVSYLSGVATHTAQYVDALNKAWEKNTFSGTKPRITLTRKTLPGYRDLSVHAVQCGGGFPHRVNLAGGVLFKENHLRQPGLSSRKIISAVERARATAPHGLKIEVEVTDLAELQQALEARADGVMLDNFTPELLESALGKVHEFYLKNNYRPFIEVSGGIRLENVASYCRPGVDVISIGALTHSVISADFSLQVEPKK